MSYAVVAVAALLVSALTLFSGFGLGTLLMPVLALFFPVEVAVGATALVHFANNVLKVSLFARKADRAVAVRFGLPAVACALVGAGLLGLLSGAQPAATYTLLGRTAVVTPLKLSMAALMLAFAVLELHPRFARLAFDRRWLPLGGALSGLFGGLSGHQGALRSAFLAKSGLPTEAFVGTNAVIGFSVDLVRLLVYGALFLGSHSRVIAERGGWGLVAVATLAAFAGVFLGSRLVTKVTMRSVQRLTGALLVLIALLLGSGLI